MHTIATSASTPPNTSERHAYARSRRTEPPDLIALPATTGRIIAHATACLDADPTLRGRDLYDAVLARLRAEMSVRGAAGAAKRWGAR